MPALAEFDLFLDGVAGSIFFAAFFFLIYVALEPFVRRRWPYRIVSWNRLLAGGFRDPLVGRDILVGALLGVVTLLLYNFRSFVSLWLGQPPHMPVLEPGTTWLGLGYFVQSLMLQIIASLQNGFIFLFLLLLIAIIVRKNRLADFLAFVIVVFIFGLLRGANDPVTWTIAFAEAVLGVGTLYRFGLLALFANLFFFHTFVFFPITSELTAWYATGFVLDLIVMAALAVYAFYISLAGQPLFSGKLFQD